MEVPVSSLVMGPTDPKPNPSADGLSHTLSPWTGSEIMTSVTFTGSDSDLQIDCQLDLGPASSPPICLIVWASPAIYGPVLLPRWRSHSPALVVMVLPLTSHSLSQQLLLLAASWQQCERFYLIKIMSQIEPLNPSLLCCSQGVTFSDVGNLFVWESH